MEISTAGSELCPLLIPEELVMDILTRLPVKSLIRFICVSKRWMALIKSPRFISIHLANTKKSFSCDDDDGDYNCRHNSCGGVVVSGKEWLGSADDGHPCFPYDFLKLSIGGSLGYKQPSICGGGDSDNVPYSIVGYCDGIFCLSWNHLARDPGTRYGRVDNGGHIIIALCNPALRELRILPLSGTDSPPYKMPINVDIGFGFDPSTNDYKVVKLVELDDSSPKALDCIEIYSMTSDSWRTIIVRGNKDYSSAAQNAMPLGLDAGIYTSAGVLHWTMRSISTGDYAIASFHMDGDSLHMTKFPSKYTTTFRQSLLGLTTVSVEHTLCLLDDKPALLCNYELYEESQRIEIFLMKNYDDDDDNSWSLATVLESFPPGFATLGFWSDKLLLVHDSLNQIPSLYDIVTKQSMELTGERGFFYRESLVSVKRGCEDY